MEYSVIHLKEKMLFHSRIDRGGDRLLRVALELAGFDEDKHPVIDSAGEASHEKDEEVRHSSPAQDEIEDAEASGEEDVVDDVLKAEGGEAREVVEVKGESGVGWKPRRSR